MAPTVLKMNKYLFDFEILSLYNESRVFLRFIGSFRLKSSVSNHLCELSKYLLHHATRGFNNSSTWRKHKKQFTFSRFLVEIPRLRKRKHRSGIRIACSHRHIYFLFIFPFFSLFSRSISLLIAITKRSVTISCVLCPTTCTPFCLRSTDHTVRQQKA